MTRRLKRRTTMADGPGWKLRAPIANRTVAATQAEHEQTIERQLQKRKTSSASTESSPPKHGLTPKEVWATVTIPGKYIEDIWKQRNPTATDPPKPEDLRAVQAEVIAKVENIVEPLVLLAGI